jgi:hypothetical protein
MASNTLTQVGLGSTDWSGGSAPVGGVHTGVCVIHMQDSASFIVACSHGEALQKAATVTVPAGQPAWVAFDAPTSTLPIILDVTRIAHIGFQPANYPSRVNFPSGQNLPEGAT